MHEDRLQIGTEGPIASVNAGVGIHRLVEIDEFPALGGRGEVGLDPIVHVRVEGLISVERDEMGISVIE